MKIRSDSVAGVVLADLPPMAGAVAVVAAVVLGGVLAVLHTPVDVAITGQQHLANTLLASTATIGALVGLGFVSAPLAAAAATTFTVLEVGTISHAGPTGRLYAAVVEALALGIVVVVVPLTARAVAIMFVGRTGVAVRWRPLGIIVATCAFGWLAAVGWSAALPSILRSALIGPGRYDTVLFVRPTGTGAMLVWVATGIAARQALGRLPRRTRSREVAEPPPLDGRVIVLRAVGGALLLTVLLGGLLTWAEVAISIVLLAGVRLIRQGRIRPMLARLASNDRRWDIGVYVAMYVAGAIGATQIDTGSSAAELAGLGWLTVGVIAMLTVIARDESAA